MAEQSGVDLFALSDLCTPWCVHVAATLRLAQHIEAGANAIDDLAARAQCDPWVLQRLLRQLVSKGVFAEPQAGHFALNDAARGLLDPGLLLGLDLDGFGGRMAHAWGTLLDYTRSGRPQYDQLFGRPFWEDLDAHPAIAAQFDALIGPAGHGAPDPRILLDDDWSAIHNVVDIGGGTGALLAEILRAHPGIHGTLVDLPRTVARAAETFAAAGVSDRATLAGQSFFDPLPPNADLYILKSILNDWPDPEALAILRRVAAAAHATTRIVIIGGASPDDGPGGLVIEMVLLGGKDRPLSEFRELVRAAGLEVVEAGTLASGRFAVECRAM